MMSPSRVRPHVLLVVAALAAGSWQARADVVTISPSQDANYTDPTGTGVFTTIDTHPTSGLDIRDLVGASPNFDHRSGILYGLASALPTGAVVQAVSFNFQAEVVTGNVGQTVGVFGYGGGSNLALTDATAPATLLTSYDNFSLGLGKHTISLGSSGVSLVQSLLSGGKILDLRLQGTTYGTNTLVDSLEMASSLPQFYSAPTITITFTTSSVPEPSVLPLLGVAIGTPALLALRRRVKG